MFYPDKDGIYQLGGDPVDCSECKYWL
jgi:hypothetical protein